jgi:hypothetical protein
LSATRKLFGRKSSDPPTFPQIDPRVRRLGVALSLRLHRIQAGEAGHIRAGPRPCIQAAADRRGARSTEVPGPVLEWGLAVAELETVVRLRGPG